VVVPLDTQLQPQEIAEILATAGATGRVERAHAGGTRARARAGRLGALQADLARPGSELPTFDQAGHALPRRARTRAARRTRDLAVLIFTRARRGRQRRRCSHSNLLTNVEAVARTFGVRPGDRFPSVLPLHPDVRVHRGGSQARCASAPACLMRAASTSKELRQDMRSSRCTLFIGVPLLYEKLLTAIHRGIEEAPAPRRALVRTLLGLTRAIRLTTGRRAGQTLLRGLRERAGLDAIRLLVTGAAPLAPEVFWGFAISAGRSWRAMDPQETSPVVRESTAPSSARRCRVAALPDQASIRRTQKVTAIAVRGPNVMPVTHQPWRPPKATAGSTRAISGAYCRTGASRSPAGSRT
jgi:long-chain acyl-CoA synthetase